MAILICFNLLVGVLTHSTSLRAPPAGVVLIEAEGSDICRFRWVGRAVVCVSHVLVGLRSNYIETTI